jgi:protein subunit release factor B
VIRYATDPEVLKEQVIIETYRSRGPGGQRKNKTETAVRLTHVPSGIVIVATEHRSQAHNRRLALERLRERLIQMNRPRRRRIPTRSPIRAVERRIETKKKYSAKKELRKRVNAEWD